MTHGAKEQPDPPPSSLARQACSRYWDHQTRLKLQWIAALPLEKRRVGMEDSSDAPPQGENEEIHNNFSQGMPHLFGVCDDFQHAGLRAYSVASMTPIKDVGYATNAPFSKLAVLARLCF